MSTGFKRGEVSSRTDELLQPERKLWTEGFCFIAGVDEAGRGPLAGPVTAAAVVPPRGVKLPDVFDSKQLSDASRRELKEEILSLEGVDAAIVCVEADIIDKINNICFDTNYRCIDTLKAQNLLFQFSSGSITQLL